MLPITHDMYLKEFSLRKNQLLYDYIFVDEKQDLNPAMYNLIDGLFIYNPKVKIISFGDPGQQIFAYRGSSERFSLEKYHYRLKESHRFGKSLCKLSNFFMNNQKVNYYTDIISNKEDTHIGRMDRYSQLVEHVKSGGKPTVIARFNMTLWHLLKAFAKNNITCALSGGIDSSELNFLKDLHNLYNGHKVRSGKLKGATFETYLRQAKIHDDKSALLACRFVESIENEGNDLFALMSNSIQPINKAQVLLTTVHQAKGLEFNDVWITKDFPKVVQDNSTILNRLKREDTHLIYTAMTRAKKSLTLPPNLHLIWEIAQVQ
jgi:superfamily I DNA/RNA helicase